MSYIIESPFPSFNDTDGSPLNNGYVYVGSANLNPVTDPIPVYWDEALTQPAAQPIRTINGYLSRNGSPGRIYTNFVTYSFRVTNNKGEQVFSDLNYTDPTSSAGSTYQQVITAIAGQTVFNLSRTYVPGTNNLFVYRNGLRLIVGQDYNETGYSQVTLTAGAANGDEFVFDIGYNYDSAASVDAQDVTYKLPAVDSVFTNVEAKLSETVSVKDFGAVGDGTTDDTAAIQAAIDSIETTGGTVVLANNGKYLVASSITIKGKVCLQGSWVNPDVSGPPTAQTYSSAGSCIRLASSATIFLAQASSIENILIYRNGMTFPTESGTGYTGTALWATGNAVALRNLLVLGFNKLFYSNGQQRHTIDRVYGDNINGIEITGAYDVCYVFDCHMWPFASNTNIYPSSGTSRSGIAYYAHDGADWIKFTNCFCYGYKTGFKIENANSSTLIGCSVDQNFASGSATHVDSIGFDITGTSVDTKMIGCQAGACWYGLVVNTVASETTFSESFSAWYPKIAGVYVQQGNASISGGIIRNTDIGITTDNANSIIHVANVKFNVISNVPIYTSVSNKTIFVSECDFGNFTSTTSGAVGFGATSQVVASSDPAVLPMTGNVFRISGTTSFGSLRWGWVGREVTLIFNGSLTVFSATGSNQNMKLSGGANFAASANTSLTLKHDGVQWFETGRSA